MLFDISLGVLLPFFGTTVGAAAVFFGGKGKAARNGMLIEGFSAGVMVAASIWSLLIPSMELAEGKGLPPAVPAAVGFLLGIVFFIFCDKFILGSSEKLQRGCKEIFGENSLSALAVAVHNLPEGMAVGAIYAEILCAGDGAMLSSAMALSIGITVQNLPEGAIISLPVHSSGKSKFKSFLLGAASGIVEPVGAVITILAAGIAVPLLPYLLGFAAGAMMYAVLEEFTSRERSDKKPLWVLSFSAGFLLMMSLDVLLS